MLTELAGNEFSEAFLKQRLALQKLEFATAIEQLE